MIAVEGRFRAPEAWRKVRVRAPAALAARANCSTWRSSCATTLRSPDPDRKWSSAIRRCSTCRSDRTGRAAQVGIDPDLPPLHADRRLLHELLANPIDNAIRCTPPGGRIEVEARRDGAAVRFAVTDDGPGIAESERERVVERFVRGSKADSQGSGLGLAIAREIAALHGGALTLAASPHPSGLRVSVALPAANAPAARG
nr:sensor histidine kinase [Lysobacter enzymogenes]